MPRRRAMPNGLPHLVPQGIRREQCGRSKSPRALPPRQDVAEFFGQPDDVLRQLLDLGAGVALDTGQWHEAGECQLQLAPRPVTVGDVACRPQALQPAVCLVTCRHPGKQPRRVTRGREKELRRLPKFSSRFE